MWTGVSLVVDGGEKRKQATKKFHQFLDDYDDDVYLSLQWEKEKNTGDNNIESSEIISHNRTNDIMRLMSKFLIT